MFENKLNINPQSTLQTIQPLFQPSKCRYKYALMYCDLTSSLPGSR